MRLSFHNIHYAIIVSRSKTLIGAVLAGLFIAALPFGAEAQQNRADPIRAAIAEVKAEEAKGRPLVQRMAALVKENEDKRKAYDATDRELKALQPRLDRYNANLAKYDVALGEYSKRVDAYNGKCGGTLPADQYRACLAEKGELAGRKIELDRDKAALETDRQAIEIDLKARTDRLGAISREMTANLQSWERTQKEYQAVFVRIDAIKKRLVADCAAGEEAKDPFAVRLCIGLGWDGEKKDFTALTDLPAPAK